MRGRPQLYTSYAADQAPLGTPTKRAWTGLLLAALLIAPSFVDRELEALLTTGFVYAIGAIGLNLVTGYAGQVSLGHAFFLALGAYTAAVVGDDGGPGIWGLGLEMWAWLPAAAIVSGLVGLAIGPIATRLKGLYLAIVTLGLVFIGEHLWREMRFVTGGIGTGRDAAEPTVFGFEFTGSGAVLGLDLDRTTRFYLLCLVLLLVAAVLSKNLTRSKVGRAWAAVRDRDVAAEVMGVPLTAAKVSAFAISSAYAGVAGALLVIANGGFMEPTFFNLFLSVNFLAMILIGGVSTLSGSLLGAGFVVLLPRLVQEFPRFLPFVEGGQTGGFLNTFQVQTLLFGVLIVAFLILEPRGLAGLWVRVRNYWRAWPFSY